MPAEAPIAEVQPTAPPSGAVPANPLAPPGQGSMQQSMEALRNIGAPKKAPEPKKEAPPEKAIAAAPVKPIKEPAKEPDASTEKVIEQPETDKGAPIKPESDKSSGPKDWKLLNTFKTENAKLKKQLEQFSSVDGEKKTLSEQLESHKKELETLRAEKKKTDDLLRFRDYQNTDEFHREYVAPWEGAWSEATNNLKGIKLVDESGTEREISRNDIQALSEMDIAAARDAIKKLVPDVQDASDVRRHTDNIRSLTGKHKTALEKAWTESEKWQKDQQSKRQQENDERQRTIKTVHEENSALFKQFDDDARSKQEYLKPVDGDDEWNARIEQAESFVNDSLVSNPNDPNLSKSERAEIIRRNTAVIHRAKMFSPLKLQNNRLKAKVAELEKTIAAYGESEPKPGNGKGRQNAPATPSDPMEAARARFRQYVT